MKTMSLVREFDRSYPTEIQTALVGVIQAAHDIADGFCSSEFAKPEANDLKPYIRRAFVEKGLVHLASRFADKVEVMMAVNPKGNSARMLRCGNVCLTASYLGENDGRVPRDAEFRNNFAGGIAQMLLHPDEERERIETLRAIKEIYAILCHRGSTDEPGVVTQASIVFVDVNCKFLADIDLLLRVASERRTGEVEHVRDEVRSVLRQDVERELRRQSAKGA